MKVPHTDDTPAQVGRKNAAGQGDDAGQGRKDDVGKPRWDLLPFEALAPIVDVLTYGAVKYVPEGWRKVPDAKARYTAALLRHLVRWKLGEATDPESGLPHLAHAGCCLLFLLALERTNELG